MTDTTPAVQPDDTPISIGQTAVRFGVPEWRVREWCAAGLLGGEKRRVEVQCTRHGKMHTTHVDRVYLRPSRVAEALTRLQARASEGDGYTRERLMQKLGCCRALMERMELACDALGGDPLTAIDGKHNGRAAKKYPPALADRVIEVWRDAKTGRVVIKGEAWLSKGRVLKRLRETIRRAGRLAEREYPWRFTDATLQAWKARCVHLGRGIRHRQLRLAPGQGVAPDWFAEADVERIEQSLLALAEGRYTDPDGGDRFTASGVAKRIGKSRSTVKNWTRDGLLLPTPMPTRRGAAERIATYTEEEAKATANRRAAAFSGTWDGGARIDLRTGAKLAGVSYSWMRETVNRIVATQDPAGLQALAPGDRRPPCGGQARTSILKTGVAWLKEQRERELAEGRLPPNWKTFREMLPYYGLSTVQEQKELSSTLPQLRKTYPESAKRVKRIKGGRMRRLWKYNVTRIDQLIADGSIDRLWANTPPDTVDPPHNHGGENARAPRWDGAERKLWLGGRLLKSFGRQPSRNQIDLIEAFESEGWAATIPDPFNDRERLHDTCKFLNRSLPAGTIRFGRDGSGEGASWAFCPEN